MQIAIEGGFAAHGDRLALGHHRPVVTAPGGVVHPGAIGFAEVVDQPFALLCGDVADRVQVQLLELDLGFRADAVDLAHG